MRRLRISVTLLLTALVLSLVPWPPALVERVYLRFLLPAVTSVTAPVVSASPLPLTLLGLVLLTTTVALLLVAGDRRRRRAGVRLAGGAVLALLLLFPLTFGLGYRLPKLADRPPAADTELDDTTTRRVAQTVLSRLQVSAALLGPTTTSELAAGEAYAAAARCVSDLATELRSGQRVSVPDRVKRLPAGLQLRFGFAGLALPWLLEPHVDAALPPASALATALHEFAHTAGFAAEAEAEAVGVVAGLECADMRVAYAASLRLARQLAAAMPEAERQAYAAQWPPRAHQHVRAEAAAVARFRGPLAPGVAAVYDLYLRSQGEAEGMREYDRGTELAIRLYAGRHP